jgi:endonuclease-8
VEARGKHLLLRFSNDDTLHTHMRMSGAWYVYPSGVRWGRPAARARVVIETGDRVAVCFDAPVVELMPSRAERVHPVLARLGQDLLGDAPLDLGAARARARQARDETGRAPVIGEVLLDQRVVAGIGNIYRCETLFACGVHPSTPLDRMADDELDRLLSTAVRLLQAGAGRGPAAAGGPWVYRRAGRPCRRCGTPITRARLGRQARTVYWCARCQPATHPPGRPSPAAGPVESAR